MKRLGFVRGVNFILLHGSKVLLLKRTDDAPVNPSTWSIPGGGIDNGETPLEAVVREAEEETGYILKPNQVIKEFDAWYKHRDQPVMNRYFIFRVTSSLIEKHEGAKMKWVDLNESFKMDIAHNQAKLLQDYLGDFTGSGKLKVGKGSKIYNPELSNISPEAVMGDNCVIHSHVWIGSGVKIGDQVKIQAFSFIPTGITIEDDVFVGPGVTFTNDKYPPSHGADWSKTVVKRGVSIGARATILPGITIGENARIGAGSVVTKDVPSSVVVCGNPAKIHNKNG